MNHLQTIPTKHICKITEKFVLLKQLPLEWPSHSSNQRDCTFMLAPGGSLWPFNEAISMALVHVKVQVDCGSTEMRGLRTHRLLKDVRFQPVFLVFLLVAQNFRPRNGGFLGMSISGFNTTTYQEISIQQTWGLHPVVHHHDSMTCNL